MSLTIRIDDPMLPIIGVNILKILTYQLNSKWPCEVSIGYAFGDKKSDLPGKLKYCDILSHAGYKIGQTAARAEANRDVRRQTGTSVLFIYLGKQGRPFYLYIYIR